jgi:hypothetical protein
MSWYTPYLDTYERAPEQVPKEITDALGLRIRAVNERAEQAVKAAPASEALLLDATVCIIAHNEEQHLISCLRSLCDTIEAAPFTAELTVVNNRSTDATERLLQHLDVRYFNEAQKGPGFARQRGLDEARGRCYLCIDADTLYPRHYVETMVTALQRKGTVCAYALWSFLPDAGHSTAGLTVYEALRDLYLGLQHIRRPELNVRGMVAAFRTAEARREGFRTDLIRGEDGSLALALKKYGKIRFVRTRRARAITGYGTLAADGSLMKSLAHRAKLALQRLGSLTHSRKEYKDEDTNLISKQWKNQ